MRRLLNKLFLLYLKAKYRNLDLKGKTTIDYNSSINIANNELVLGDNVHIRSKSRGYHAGMPFPSTIFIDVDGASVSIGNNSRLNGVYVHAQKEIKIGENCVIAAGVNILDSNGHIVNSTNRTKGRDTPESIIIGNNVWIGLNSTILKGTNIGDNSIVAAGSVVKGNFPKNSIIASPIATAVSTLNLNNQ